MDNDIIELAEEHFNIVTDNRGRKEYMADSYGVEAFGKAMYNKGLEEIINAMPGGDIVDPQWVCDAIRNMQTGNEMNRLATDLLQQARFNQGERQMNIEELTLKQIKEIQALTTGITTPSTSHPLIGKNVIIRTVTMIYTGRFDHVTSQDYVLVDCSWIPETDRFMQFVADGSVRECEPYPDGLPVYINRGALLDVCELVKPLPRSQK